MTHPKELIETLPARTRALREEIAKAIVGQERVVEDVLLGLYCGEHVLLTGVPGLAKTLLFGVGPSKFQFRWAGKIAWQHLESERREGGETLKS